MWLFNREVWYLSDPDPKWFIPDPDPAKSSGSDRIRIHNTGPNSRNSAKSSRIHSGSSLNSCNKHRITAEIAAGRYCSPNSRTAEIAAGRYCSPNSRTAEIAAGRYCSPNSRKSARSSRIHSGSSLDSYNKHMNTAEIAAGRHCSPNSRKSAKSPGPSQQQ